MLKEKEREKQKEHQYTLKTAQRQAFLEVFKPTHDVLRGVSRRPAPVVVCGVSCLTSERLRSGP